jgi:hypothetical protein
MDLAAEHGIKTIIAEMIISVPNGRRTIMHIQPTTDGTPPEHKWA